MTRCANCESDGADLPQLGLSDQNQLQKLVFVGVDVGEHPKIFQRLDREVLRLVDHYDHIAALGIFLDHEVLELAEHGDVVAGVVRLEPQRVENPAKQLAAPRLRVRDQPDRDIVLDLRQQSLHERRLAGPHLAGDDGERRPDGDTILQNGVGLGVGGRPEQEVGIRQQREGPLGESEMTHVKVDTHNRRVSLLRCRDDAGQ